MQVRGMYSGRTLHACKRNVQGTDIASFKFEITLMDITSNCLLSSSQEPSKCLLFCMNKRNEVIPRAGYEKEAI